MSEENVDPIRRQLEADCTRQQVVFCNNYVGHFNAARAARDAGYSAHTAREQGYDLLTRPHIRAYVDYLTSKLVSDAEISRERILKELARRAFFSVKDLYDEDGQLLHPSELPDDVASAIDSIDIEVVGKFGKAQEGEEQQQILSIKYKAANGDKSLEQLGRYHAMFTDNKHLTGKVTLEDLVVGDDGE